MQTHEWEALLDGTTEGPWKFEEHYETEYPAGVEWGPMLTSLEHHVLAGEKHLFGAYNDYALIEYPGNLLLAAAAPAAVAEVIRLRRELEKLKGDLIYSAMCAKAQDESGAVQTTTAKRLTRILEGDTEKELVLDPAYAYRDRDGDEWEHIDGRWITARTHAERVDWRNMGLGHDGLPADYGPYTRIEKEETNE